MRELRFVGPGEDAGRIVVETCGATDGDGTEQFELTVTDELRTALTRPRPEVLVEPVPRRPSPTPAVETLTDPSAEPAAASEPHAAPAKVPTIPPREIQIRVRAGETPESIAEETGADLASVMRFAGPVIEERGRITNEARRARARRNPGDAQTVLFGETVDERFAAHGIEPAEVSWDAIRREDGQWIVSAGWVGGGQDRTAEWLFHLGNRTVSALDDTAAELLSDRPVRPIFAEPPVTAATVPPLAPGVVAFPAMPNAHTGPLPDRDQLFDQERFGGERLDAELGPRHPSRLASVAERPVAERPVAERPVAERPVPPPDNVDETPVLPLTILEPVPTEELELDVDFFATDESDSFTDEADTFTDEPAQPTLKLTNLGVAHRDALLNDALLNDAIPTDAIPTDALPPHDDADRADDEKAARAHIPSWDDILLGVRRKND